MSTGTTRRFTLLVNPTAGGGQGRRYAGVVERVLRSAGARVDVLCAPDPDLALQWGRQAVAGSGPSGHAANEHCLVAVGGDGTVHLALQVLAGTDTLLGVVACGSGDDAARTWGLPRGDPHRAAHVLLTAPAGAVDLGVAEDAQGTRRWFATVAATGFDAKVTERSLGLASLPGPLRYLSALVSELREFTPLSYRLALDGEAVLTDAMLVAVGNGPSYGGGMQVTPRADPTDGLLDVLILHPLPTAEFVRVFPRVYRGTHLSHPAVQTRRSAVVEVDALGVVAFADGEALGALPQRFSVLAGGLDVVGFTGAAGRAPDGRT